MANFELKEISLGKINNGEKYQNGDRPSAEAFNAPIEASAYAQKIAKEAKESADLAMQKVNDSAAGAVTLSAYPVGSLYISVSETSPAALFGGTWERIKDRFILGSGDTYLAGSVGGEATHKLTIDEMPSHRHDIKVQEPAGQFSVPLVAGDNGTTYGPRVDYTWIQGKDKYYADNTGGGAAHNNMPPYLVVNMWKRVA